MSVVVYWLLLLRVVAECGCLLLYEVVVCAVFVVCCVLLFVDVCCWCVCCALQLLVSLCVVGVLAFALWSVLFVTCCVMAADYCLLFVG